MIVEFVGGIAAAHGTLRKNPDGSRIVITTRKAASTNPNKVRMYLRSADSYKRKAPVSDKEMAARTLFARRQAYVQELLASGRYHTKAEAWKIAKATIKS